MQIVLTQKFNQSHNFKVIQAWNSDTFEESQAGTPEEKISVAAYKVDKFRLLRVGNRVVAAPTV